ncbi:unnamed protein product [Rotaria socialis]|uniref:Uncharacterized protein n=1 Tax=Rotaria socialis TaxID=392032 RepID=A0A821C9E4_9BILA|nr:unnamed protein product [Rotaria socialis]CAF4852349.1 unnamed protein product [Rotaria socialis]
MLIYDLQVIPNLVPILTQDAKVRSVIANFLSSIRSLSICIRQGADTIKVTKGSSRSIEIAEQTISAAFTVLADCSKEAAALENTAVVTVAEEIGELHGMIISKAKMFDTQKAEINIRLAQNYKELERIRFRRQYQQGKREYWLKLIRDTEKLIKDAEKYLEEVQHSNNEMIALNEKDEIYLQSTSKNVQRTVTEKCDCTFACYRNHQRIITGRNVKEAAHTTRLESEVAQRKVDIHENKINEAEETKFMNSLNQNLDVYKTGYQTIQNEIDSIQKHDIENQATAFNGEFEQTIIDKFTQIAASSKNLYHEDSIGSQIVSILKACENIILVLAIKEHARDSIMLLTSGHVEHAAHATKRLLKQASFLSKYLVWANDLLQPSSKYSAFTSAT